MLAIPLIRTITSPTHLLWKPSKEEQLTIRVRLALSQMCKLTLIRQVLLLLPGLLIQYTQTQQLNHNFKFSKISRLWIKLLFNTMEYNYRGQAPLYFYQGRLQSSQPSNSPYHLGMLQQILLLKALSQTLMLKIGKQLLL